MNKLIRWSSVVLLIAATFAFAQEGELRGKITDKNSGQPVVGVTVTLEGFDRNAVADENGGFVLLGVWPGSYVVRISRAQNEALSIAALDIHAFMTTRLDVQWAERTEASSYSIKLIESAGTVHRIEQNYIQNTPVRGLENLLKLETGVLEQNGELYIRSGFAGELSSFLNGVSATSLLGINGNAAIEAIPEAIEEIQLYSGAFGAELGNSNLAPACHFLAGQHGYTRNRTVSFVEPFQFENLTDDCAWDCVWGCEVRE